MCRAGAVFVCLLYAAAAPAADELRRFEDFFRVNDRDGRLRYIAVARFWSDIDNRYLAAATRRAIDSGLTEGLSRSGDTMDFTALRGSVEAAFVDEFITTLAIYKIVNKRLQFDLYHLPVLDDPDRFGPELASNRLVRLNDTGGLQAAMAHARAPVSMPALREAFDLITETAPAGERYTYLGGVITVSARILDLRPNYRKPRPKPRQNAVKGFVRLRRFFTAHRFDDAEITGNNFAWPAATAGTQYVTVDHISKFSIGQPRPRPRLLNIHFGLLLDGYDNDLQADARRREGAAPEFLLVESVPLLRHIGHVERANRPARTGVPTLWRHGSARKLEVQRLSIRLPSGALAPGDCQVTGYSVFTTARRRRLQQQFAELAGYLELERFGYTE
ncbi:MAG: hypothetical protein QGF67_03405 [Lentisphaeria bacterium]|jgi:hypothetical protein|nr:hypothetical protein [Lentisphaeria bacterium]MDP7740460.1 hypothetical protein [Lentisphaeria bacterium]